MRSALSLSILTLVLGATACPSAPTGVPTGTSAPVTGASPEQQPPPSEPPPPPNDPPAGFKGSLEPTEKPGSGTPRMLKAVRTAAHERYDRMAFEFVDSLPGYKVSYVDSATNCGSGEPVTVEGGARLMITLSPSVAHDESGKSTLEQRTVKAGLPAIKEHTVVCDHEGRVGILVGVPGMVPFGVSELSDPPRLAIDIGH